MIETLKGTIVEESEVLVSFERIVLHAELTKT